jgi:hypothetical protein
LSISPGPEKELPLELTTYLLEIQKQLKGMPLWLLIHDGDEDNDIGWLSEEVWKNMYNSSSDFKQGEPIALIIDSPGGDAPSAYRIAKFLRNKCGKYTAIIPKYAKSAATLLSLGADEIYVGKEGDLGPLDVQISDYNEEKVYSALDEVQAIDSLFDFATNRIIQTTAYWSTIMKKKRQVVLPMVIDYVIEMMKPLMEKIDTVHYMSLSRSLLIAEEYAYRLLVDKYKENARRISKNFVKNYPYHGFIIDIKEAQRLGLRNVGEIPEEMQNYFDKILDCINGNYLIGKFYTKTVV